MSVKQPFETVVAVHGPAVLRVCRAVLGPADADDAWSETFLSAMKAYPDLARLPGRQKQAVAYPYLAGLPYTQVAAILGGSTDAARLAGNPKAFRAVGSACAANPLPVIVPCHRVVRADGGIGGYLGGVQAKRTLLSLEAGVSRGPGRDRSRGRADTAEAVA